MTVQRPVPSTNSLSTDIAPASFAQRRLWLVDRLGGAGYTIALALPFASPPDPCRLAAALTTVVARHAPLRTLLHERDGEPVQHILPPAPVPLASSDASDLAALAAAERARPLDIQAGPILRATLAPAGLVLAIHHAAFDGWSAAILLNELAAAYRSGSDPALPPLPATYADYARLQRATSPNPADLAHWRDRLAGITPIPLPTDRPPTPAVPATATTLPVQLTPAIGARLDALAQAADTTLFVVLLAAFQAWLHRISGAPRIAVGIPVAGRDDAAFEPLVGLFVNLLVLDADLSDAPGFLTLLARVRTAMREALDHRTVPFDQLVQSIAHDRASGRNPLFNVAFALQQAPAAPDFGPCGAGIPTLHPGVRFDLELYLWRDGDGLAGTLIADAACIGPATLAAMRQSFLVLLARLVSAPDQPVTAHALLTQAQHRQVAAIARPQPRPLPHVRIEALFANQAAQNPNAPAILDEAGTLTYAELDALAARMSGALWHAGIRPGGLVALLAPRSRNAIAALLAILRCGAAYLPLDPESPPERRDAMLEEARPALLLTEAAIAGLAASAAPPPTPRLPTNATAYVNYTSGSTGRPKGIAIPHGAVIRLATSQSYLALAPGNRVGHAASLAFDAATFEIWSTLLAGAAIVILPRATVIDPAPLGAALTRHQVDTLFLTTALFHQLIDSAPESLAGLDTLLFGGEACDPARVARAIRLPGRLLHVYGPTESTTFAAWHHVTQATPDIPIGRPLDNTELWVLDPHHSLVPPGGTGELHIGGDGLATGYLGNPALTADRFIPDPISGHPGRRLYRTGDLVRLGHDGAITFLGRIDRQLKIRGHRVEPGEIEAALQRLPGVAAAIVIPRPAPDGTTALAAWAAGPTLDAASLRESLRAALPDWMVPATIVTLPTMPLTPNGKIDRAALPEPQSRATAPPSDDPIENEVALLVAEILALPAVSPHDDIFALGGHSLSMTRLAARLRSRFRVEIPLAPLFEEPTPAAIARIVRDAMGEGEAPSITPHPELRYAPASFAQSRLWFLDRMGLTGAAYHSFFTLRLRGPLDAPALDRALLALARRHAPLRTVFLEVDGQPRQHILPEQAVMAGLVPATHAVPPTQAEAAIAAFCTIPFDLAQDTPLRALLQRTAPDDHRLTLVFHHIAFDGWSLPIVARDLSALYAGHPLPPLPIQYADYALWQRTWLDAPRTARLLAWWTQRLAGIEDLDLPTDFARPALETHEGGTTPIAWPRALTDSVLAFAQAARTTPYIVLLAGFTALLHRYTAQDRIVVGAPIANRTRDEVQDLVGFFVNSLVLATDCSGDPTFHDLLDRVRETALDAYAHADLPFERLVEALRPQRDLGRHPLFQTVFVLQQSDAMAPRFDLPGIDATLVPAAEIPVRFDLEFHLALGHPGLSGWAFYNRALFEPATIARMTAQYQTLMAGLVAAPARPIAAIPLEHPAALDDIAAWSHA